MKNFNYFPIFHDQVDIDALTPAFIQFYIRTSKHGGL
jgi:hypothetical protein